MKNNERQNSVKRFLGFMLALTLLLMIAPTVQASGDFCFRLSRAESEEMICPGEVYEFDLTVDDIVVKGGLIGINNAVLSFDPVVFRLNSVEPSTVEGWQMDYAVTKPGEIVFNPAEIDADGQHAVTENGVIAFHISLIGLAAEKNTTVISLVHGNGTSTDFQRTDPASYPSLTYACEVCQLSPGDVNLDGNFDRNDAVYLLYATVFNEGYPLPASGDFNGDQKFDRNDAVYLLFASIFGEGDYPLEKAGPQ